MRGAAATLLGLCVLFAPEAARAASCGELGVAEIPLLALTQGEMPLNAHVFALANGEPPTDVIVWPTATPSKSVRLQTSVHPLKSSRVLELVPQTALDPRTEYAIGSEATHQALQRFRTTDGADLVAPTTPFDTAVDADGGTHDRCDPRFPIELKLSPGTTLDAAYVYVWLPDDADDVDLSAPPDFFDTIGGAKLQLVEPLDMPTKIGVQLVDGAGNVSGRREVAVGSAPPTFAKRCRVLGARLRRSFREHRLVWIGGGLALLLAVIGGVVARRGRQLAR